MNIETFAGGHLVERWDDTARIYTRWDGNGTQLEERPYTAEENTAAGARAAAQTVAANRTTLTQRAAGAIAANTADITQTQTIRTQADTLAGGTGTYTTAQLSGYVRQLAAGVRLLADHDIATKRQVNTLIRLVADLLDSTDGTA